ncbi:RluA family pseudouridine synthase [Cyanobium sp. WAJ14-Wanaka]|nr:RluA family pseudouridine synthase [Cyanobium sp. WAJ14-Wanaka]
MWSELNRGHAYRDRVALQHSGQLTSFFYASRYPHSSALVWLERLAAGEICLNGQQLRADGPLAAGDQLVWHRPPWQEPAVPVLPSPLFDDGDLLVFDKPSGLPVLPAGGFLEHTLLAQLQASWPPARPVHRLGRHTSGLLVCARQSSTRAWLSAQLRDSTAASPEASLAASPSSSPARCQKTYRALTAPLPPDWSVAESRPLTTPIGRRPHPLLGEIWCAVPPSNPSHSLDPTALPAHSQLTLLERRQGACLVEVAIASGRPHQIRIHAAAAGAPLWGDPLYLAGGLARPDALPGDGGYQLHAHRLQLARPDGALLKLEAPLPTFLITGPGHGPDQLVALEGDQP